MSQEQEWIKKLQKILVTAEAARLRISNCEDFNDPIKDKLVANIDVLINAVKRAIEKLQDLTTKTDIDWNKLAKDIADYKG